MDQTSSGVRPVSARTLIQGINIDGANANSSVHNLFPECNMADTQIVVNQAAIDAAQATGETCPSGTYMGGATSGPTGLFAWNFPTAEGDGSLLWWELGPEDGGQRGIRPSGLCPDGVVNNRCDFGKLPPKPPHNCLTGDGLNPIPCQTPESSYRIFDAGVFAGVPGALPHHASPLRPCFETRKTRTMKFFFEQEQYYPHNTPAYTEGKKTHRTCILLFIGMLWVATENCATSQ